jgi:hypothetical protein
VREDGEDEGREGEDDDPESHLPLILAILSSSTLPDANPQENPPCSSSLMPVALLLSAGIVR